MSAEVAERRLSLYDIDESLALALSEAEEAEGPEEKAALDALIRDYVHAKLAKVDGIRGYLRHAKAQVAEAKEEAARAREFADAIQARIDRLEGYVLAEMQATGQKRIEGRAGAIILKGNGGLAPLKIQEDVLPDEYRDVTLVLRRDHYLEERDTFIEMGLEFTEKGVALSNARIRESLKAGETVPGAWLEDRGQHIEIR